MTLTVNPVLSGQDYEKAMASFNEAMRTFKQQQTERDAQLSTQKASLQASIQAEKAAAQRRYDEQIAAYRTKGQTYGANDLMIRRKILNRFQATSFGIWNCDRPLPPYLVKVKGEFTDQAKTKNYDKHTAYLVDKTRNTVCRFYTGDGVEVAYNKNADNLLWIMTDDHKIALLKPEEFDRISKDKSSYATFVMDLVDQKIESEEDVREILEF